jgi:acyl-CoA reductase-like NAD-dependent aldehyde dehydrogenase
MSSFPDYQHSFGGFKQSGFGKDMGEYALEAYVVSLDFCYCVPNNELGP